MSLDPGDLYDALRADTGRLRTMRRLVYRCPNRCLLLDAIELGETVLLHQERFKNSGAVNLRRSNEAGREANTYDGRNHWFERSYFIDQSALSYPDSAQSGQSLQCDHVGVLADGSDLMLSARDFQDDWASGLAKVTMRADGTRFGVE